MSDMVQTPRGAGQIIDSDTVRGRTSHLVKGAGWTHWYPETQVRVASLEDGWEPIPEDEFPGNPYSDAMPPQPEDAALAPMGGGDPNEMGDLLQGLSEFAATGEVSPEDIAQYAGPEEDLLVAHLLQAGPGDNVDDSNSVRLPYNPDPQHDATYSTPDASWGPGEYTIDADERLHPSNSLTLNDVPHSEAGDEPGPANHLFAAREAELDAREAALRLYGPQPKLGSKYATPLLYQSVDHFNDPVQRFRDDPVGAIERRGSTYQTHDPELDRYAALLDTDRQIRTGGWKDIQRKAKRLRREGKIQVKDIGPDRIYASVQGDTGTYETMITKGSSLGGYDAYGPHGGQSVGNWHCSCKWGNWAFKRRFTFVGRLCSHGLASYWEMQANHNNDEKYVDKRRNRVKTKRSAFDPDDRRMTRDRGLGELIDHYGPHDKIDREQEFDRRTDLTQDYAEFGDWSDAEDMDMTDPRARKFFDHDELIREQGIGGDIPNILDTPEHPDVRDVYAHRTADFLRTTPRGMTPTLNHIPREREHETVDVTSLEDTDMLGAAAEGTEREAAHRLGRRFVAWIVDEVLPQFEEWYKRNHGRQLDQARPTEASQGAAQFAHEVGLDQATTEMLQEFINQDFGPEDMAGEGEEEHEEIKHFTSAAGRYLMARARIAAPYDPMDLLNPGQAPGQYDSQSPLIAPFNGLETGNPMVDPLTGPGAGYGADDPGGTGLPWVQDGAGNGAPSIGLNTDPGGTTQAPEVSVGGGAGNAGSPAVPANPGSPEVDLASAETSTAGGGKYTVQEGDTLSDIAQANGMGDDWQSLYDTNKDVVGGDADLILPGQELTLPGSEHGGTGAAPGPEAEGTAGSWFGGGSDGAAAPQGPGLNGDAPLTGGSGGSATEGGGPVVGPSSAGTPMGYDVETASDAATGMVPTTGAPATAENPAGSFTDLMVPDLGGTTGPSTNTDTGLTPVASRHRLASDESLINHLRDLSTTGVQGRDYGNMAQRNSDVRKTVDELRDRGYDANQLVAALYHNPREAKVAIGADFRQVFAEFSSGEDDEPLLGDSQPEATKVPSGFAGSGPDHQSWASSSEDYVEKYEQKFRQNVDGGEGNITRYSSFDAALMQASYRQANAFDNYADWASARAEGSGNPSDWDSVETFLSEAADRQEGVSDLEPSRDIIDNRLEYHASRHQGAGGFFGVGADFGFPTADGLAHSNGAANLRGVTKPKKVKPPRPPGLQQAPPKPPQLFQPPQQQQLAQPRQPMVQGPQSTTNALGKPKRTTGGIARQGQQLQQGTLNTAFGEMGVPDPGMVAAYGNEPQYHEAGAFPTAMTDPYAVGGYDGYSGVPDYQPPPPSQHLGGFGWDPLPGQDGTPNAVAQHQGPVDSFGARRLATYMGTAPGAEMPQRGHQMGAHDPQAAAAMGEYRTPHVASYGQTDDSSDVVRHFQATMGMGGGWSMDYQPTGPGGGYGMGMPPNARTAGRTYSLAQQAELEQEAHVHGARNLPDLDLRGTHYLGEA